MEYIWLVVYLPLWKIWFRQLGLLFPIYYSKIKNVPNHQPDIYYYIVIYYIFFCSAISQVQRGWRRKKVAQPNRATARWQIPEVKVKVYNLYTICIHMCGIRYIFYLDTAFTHFANDHRKHHLCSSAFLATFIAHWPTGWTSRIPRTLCRVLWVHRAAALATLCVSWSSTTFPYSPLLVVGD